MKNNEDKLDILLSKLRHQKPGLRNAELFTDSIMKEIKSKSHRPKPPVLIWIRAVSSSAAVLLLGLFLFQQNDTEMIVSNSQSTHFIENKIIIDPNCNQNFDNEPVNLIKTYFCYIQHNSYKNNQLRSHIQLLTN